MIQKAIHSILEADGTVTGYSSNISHGLMNQESQMPYYTFIIFNQTGNPTKDTTSELDELSIQVNCVSRNNEEAINMAEAVRSALDGYSGAQDSTVIQSIDFDKYREAYDGQSRAFVMGIEFIIFIEK